MLIVAFFLIVMAFYCLLATLFKLPTFRASSTMFKKPKKKKQGTLSSIANSFSKVVAKYIPVGMLKKAELEKTLRSADIKLTPQEYIANAVVKSVVFFIAASICLFINKVLAIISLVFAGYTFYRAYAEAGKQSNKRKLEIEKELPRFVSYMSNSLKSNRNIIDIIDVYKANYYSVLTEELAKTVADMRTGNEEKALQRFEVRINSPLLSELVRGMLSSIRGNDMTIYFENLNYKLSSVWQQRLRAQALKKEPKVTIMSYFLFGSSLITVFAILAAVLYKAVSTMGF